MKLRHKIGFTALVLALGSLTLLCWLADDRRGVAWAVAFVRRTFPEVPQHSPAAVAGSHSTLLDARSQEEFAMSHLPGALHMDVETVTPDQIRALDPKQAYVVYCSAGYRSCQLARRLSEAGITDVRNLEGGIFAWANGGHPVHRGDMPVSEVHPYHALFARFLKPQYRPHGR